MKFANADFKRYLPEEDLPLDMVKMGEPKVTRREDRRMRRAAFLQRLRH